MATFVLNCDKLRGVPGGLVRAQRAARRAGFHGTITINCGRKDTGTDLTLLGRFYAPHKIQIFVTRCPHWPGKKFSAREDFKTLLHELGHFRRNEKGIMRPSFYTTKTEAARDPEERAAELYAEKELQELWPLAV